MKIDFYDLFSLHTPEEFPEEVTDNYTAAAVKSRVMDNISENKRKPVRISRIGKIFLSAAAAAVVLVTGTLAASALGFIDLEKIFGGIFNSGTEYLDGITTVPQDVTVTGDNRLSFKVLGIGGTKNEAFGAIEVKRNDGGVFPEHIGAIAMGNINASELVSTGQYICTGEFELIDETTAIVYFRNKVIMADHNESIIGTTYTYTLSKIFDTAEFAKLQEKYGVYIDDEDDKAYLDYIRENKDVVLDGDWTVTFPLDYNIEKRSVNVNEPFRNVDCGIWSSVITNVEYSSVTLDISLEKAINYGRSVILNNVSVKLDSGEEFIAPCSYSSTEYNDAVLEKNFVIHFSFDKPIDIDSVESITIGDVIIPVK